MFSICLYTKHCGYIDLDHCQTYDYIEYVRVLFRFVQMTLSMRKQCNEIICKIYSLSQRKIDFYYFLLIHSILSVSVLAVFQYAVRQKYILPTIIMIMPPYVCFVQNQQQIVLSFCRMFIIVSTQNISDFALIDSLPSTTSLSFFFFVILRLSLSQFLSPSFFLTRTYTRTLIHVHSYIYE